MAQRRMFSRSVISSDGFNSLRTRAKLMYVFLGMEADDDGFVGNPKSVARMARVPPSALDELADAGFIIPFKSGAVAIRHWRVNNHIRRDRYTKTLYSNELSTLCLDGSGVYRERDGIPSVQTSDSHSG